MTFDDARLHVRLLAMTEEERFEDIRQRIEFHIAATPSGEARNFLSEINIKLMAYHRPSHWTT